jgi:hypothetical protein
MRRQIIILLVAVLAAAVVEGGYPEEYYGPPILEGCIEIQAYVPEGWYLDRYPWSAVGPEEKIFWFGTLCVEGAVAVIEFTEFGSRHCYENPFGFEECWSSYQYDITEPDRHVMAWDPSWEVDWGFYQAQVSIGEWNFAYDSVTNRGDGTFMFVQGVWHFDPPFWWAESDEFSRWKFLVAPKTAKKLQLFRRLGGRHAP